jgi:curli biogenesis system outer membrane secretion channel CsgG
MKTFLLQSITILLFTIISINCFSQAKKVTFEEVQSTCKGIKREDRTRITVARFSVSSRAAQATGQFGEELTAIMTNALQQTNCFRVLESLKNEADLETEIARNETGATNGSGPQRGKQLSAQAIVTAEITEYNDGESEVNLTILSIGTNKAKLGVIVKVIDPETRELLWSKSINAEGKKGGFTGVSLGGFSFAGSTRVSEAMSAAVEDLVLKTMEVLVKEKDEIMGTFEGNVSSSPKSWNSTNCTLLSGTYKPRVMVIVPEYHIQMPIPDPAGETEILRKLLEAGFKVVDPSVLATIRTGKRFKDAVSDPMAAVALGRDFGADIVIFGEAFSQAASRENGRFTCRARVEVKAVRTDNAEMLATNGFHAGGQDIAESTASKTALRNAGAGVADYLLGQFCISNETFTQRTNNTKPVLASPGKNNNLGINTYNISIENVSFIQFNNIIKSLTDEGKSTINNKALKNKIGTFTIVSEMSKSQVVDIIKSNCKGTLPKIKIE